MRRIAAGLVVAAVGAVVAFQGSGPAGVIVWQMVVLAAAAVVVWRNWPRSDPVPGLAGTGTGLRRRPLAHLATLELEVVGATSTALGGDARLRRRLVALAEHRAGVAPGAIDPVNGPEILGVAAWDVLSGTGSMSADEIDLLVGRIEKL
ncbi:MAG TPA: hypothetical protein VJ938_06810 [Acidimicrobiia bacterium]|nr:hypothetical protein [Acidimicrobiia bacterium]